MKLSSHSKQLIKLALAEDIGAGDVTSNLTIPVAARGKYNFVARQELVFCGAEILKALFPKIKIRIKDGQKIKPKTIIAEVEGNVRTILKHERVALNFIQHFSGIATLTAKYVEAVKGTKAKVLDTRKTIPALRELTKYAVKCGGGTNHRMGLYDMVLIKDNHIRAAGGIASAIQRAASSKQQAVIEVECDNVQQVKEAVAAGADIILADNMNLTNLKKAVSLCQGKCKIEASGNVNLKTILAIAKTGVDYISTSKITMSAPAVDVGLDEIEGVGI